MLTTDRLLAVLPVGLVPLAWGFTGAVAVGVVGRRPLVIGLGVMTVLFVVFAAHPAMSGPVLGDWRWVIVAGLLANAVAIVDLLVVAPRDALVPVAAFAWMLVPAPALVRTGRAVGAPGRYLLFAVLSVLGALVVGAGWLLGGVAGWDATAVVLAGVALVAAGQTGSIADAAVRNGTTPLGA